MENQLKMVLDKVVSESENAFVRGTDSGLNGDCQ